MAQFKVGDIVCRRNFQGQAMPLEVIEVRPSKNEEDHITARGPVGVYGFLYPSELKPFTRVLTEGETVFLLSKGE